MSDKGALPWRTGTRVGRTIYDAHGQLIGTLDTPELAAMAVAAVNSRKDTNEPPPT